MGAIKPTVAAKKLQTSKKVTSKVSAANGGTFSQMSKLESFLNKHYEFKRNVVNSRVMLKLKTEKVFRLMTEVELNSIYRFISKNNIRLTIGTLEKLIKSDFTHSFDPFKDYLFGLPKHKGASDYIDLLADCVPTANQEYWKKCFKTWIVALVASLIEEDVVNHQVIVLSGKQGVGKTTFVYSMIPKELKSYFYSGSISLKDRDTSLMISECMLINLDELGSLNRSDISGLKELITKNAINLRKPYAPYSEIYIRRASFIGSVNGMGFLTDTTGNRRFLSHEVINFINTKHSIDLDKVYAQALHLYKTGFKFYFDKEDIDEIEKNNERFRDVSIEEELLLNYFEPIAAIETDDFMSATDVLVYLQKFVNIVMSNATKQNIGKALTKLGFNRVKRKGSQVYAVKLKNKITK